MVLEALGGGWRVRRSVHRSFGFYVRLGGLGAYTGAGIPKACTLNRVQEYPVNHSTRPATRGVGKS